MSQPPEHPPSPVDLLRDKRAIVDTGLGPVAFVAVYAIWGLNTAIVVALAISVVLMVERLVRGKSVVNALGGVFGTAIAAFIAHKTGKAETFFVPRMLIQLGYGLVFAGSVIVRRPLTGFIIAALYRADPGWWKLPAVKRAMSELTLAWAGLFLLRAAVYAYLIYLGKPGGLAAASLGLGWPAFGLLMFVSYRYVPRRLEQLGAPDPRALPPAA
ncbi:MAG TPA: DUF3159 domain-containing protein [Solirubrobacter sp.]|nr:DUF3159 domain-containing protein [Solirubrobacter sp.]